MKQQVDTPGHKQLSKRLLNQILESGPLLGELRSSLFRRKAVRDAKRTFPVEDATKLTYRILCAHVVLMKTFKASAGAEQITQFLDKNYSGEDHLVTARHQQALAKAEILKRNDDGTFEPSPKVMRRVAKHIKEPQERSIRRHIRE